MTGEITIKCLACRGKGGRPQLKPDVSMVWRSCPVCEGEGTITHPLSMVTDITITDTGIEKCGKCPYHNYSVEAGSRSTCYLMFCQDRDNLIRRVAKAIAGAPESATEPSREGA